MFVFYFLQIATAVNFLNNPKVGKSTLLQKRNFLKTKGLTDEEIQLAFEKVGVFVKMSENDETRINMRGISNPGRNYNHQLTRFEKIKDILSSTALIGAITYAIYMFYKVFILHKVNAHSLSKMLTFDLQSLILNF